MQKYGTELREIFMFEPNYVNLNSGSYGCFPKCVDDAKKQYLKRMAQKPDEFIRYVQEDILYDAKCKASHFVGVDPKQTVFMINTSDAYNAVMKSFDYKEGDKLLLSNISYKMNKQLIYNFQRRYKIQPIEVNFTRQSIQTKESIVKCYEEILNQHKDIRIAVVDHISSQPSIIFPLEETVKLFRKLSPQTIIFVDGAHAVGQLKLDISQYDVDFYCTNFHKWAYSPRPVALLYIKDCHLDTVQPNIIANYADEGLQRSFYWQGTQDQTSYMATSQAIDFINSYGLSNIIEYCHNLVIEGAKKIADIWKTDLLVSDETLYGNMCMVRVPESNIDKGHQIFKIMLQVHQVAIFEAPFLGHMYARFSAQIFNNLDEYIQAGELFLQVQQSLI